MDSTPGADPTLNEAAKRIARRASGILENRLGLLVLEVQEERERLLQDLLLALGVAAFGLLAGLSLTVTLVVLFWAYSPLIVLLVMTVLFTSAGVFCGLLLKRRLGEWQALPASVDQLEKDRACFEKLLN
jgi:uncharacterized membrane protein YqjE